MFLNCKTNYSFLYGTLSTEQLVETASAFRIDTLALTNINNICDAWEFVQLCQLNGIKPLVGCEIRNGPKLLYILLASSGHGFKNVNGFLSRYAHAGMPFPDHPVDNGGDDELSDVFIIYPFSKKFDRKLSPNEFIGIMPSEVNKLYGIDPGLYKERLVVRHPITFMDKRHQTFNVHKLLRAIDANVLLSKLSPLDLAGSEEVFITPSEITRAFSGYDFILTNTSRLIDSCNIEIDFGRDKTKKCFGGSEDEDRLRLKELAYQGLAHRYGRDEVARKRLETELEAINRLGFNAYFLIAADITRYARHKGFYYVGRGSGANSVVAYSLYITDVDPIELNLYFEIFLNSQRSSPPDFDIDFSWLDRDEVTNYIFNRYNYQHVAQLGSCQTFQYNATIRELGKVFGLPKSEIDQLGHAGRYYGPGRVLNGLRSGSQNNMHHLIEKYGNLITGFPRHLSVHSGGILVTEEPIHQYSATFLPSKNLPTTQIDMYTGQIIGLHKIDILSQRGLGHIKETIKLIRENKNETVDIFQVEKFKTDPFVQEQVKQVSTIGCFYIESPGMRQLLTKLACSNYLTLVAASAIIRPGVASSGMMKEYIARYHQPGRCDNAHPLLRDILQETFGIMIYQEDVIRVAHHFGGLNMEDADMLRRGLSGKYKNHQRFESLRDKFFQNCRNNAYSDALTSEVWRQMEAFAGYSFSKAHSASFAAESFQDLFLKAYYPLEFMVGVINNFGGFYSTAVYFYELLKAGATLHLPCVNCSQLTTTISGNDVFTGLIHIKELEKAVASSIIKERQRDGDYLHLQDFIERTSITMEQLNILINIGAFRFTGKNKKELLWEANFLQKRSNAHMPSRNSLFVEKPKNFILPQLSNDPVEDIYDEVEILGFPLRNPFDLVNDDPSLYPLATSLPAQVGNTVTTLGYFVTDKVVPTKNRQTMSFGTFLDPALNWLDTVHFPKSLHQSPLQGQGFYRLTGKVVEDNGWYSVDVTVMKKIGYRARKYVSL